MLLLQYYLDSFVILIFINAYFYEEILILSSGLVSVIFSYGSRCYLEACW